jgi:dTDP-4-dehydrorhamnose reductase
MYLLVGGDSEIGNSTADYLKQRGMQVVVTTRRLPTPGRLSLDLETIDDEWRPPDGVTAACIFVAVARLAACESDPARSSRINCDKTILLISKLVSAGIFTLFLSSNQVYDGNSPHVPFDLPHSPVSVYGRQKAVTESALFAMQERGLPVAILRLGKVISPGMKLLTDWRKELLAGHAIGAFVDMSMAPVAAIHAAQAIDRLLAARLPTVAQLSGPEDFSYAKIARLIACEAGADQRKRYARRVNAEVYDHGYLLFEPALRYSSACS